MLNILKNDNNHTKTLEQKYIQNDIDTLMDYFKKCKNLDSKKEARKKLLLYKLKELSLNSKNKEIHKVQQILESNESYEAIKKILIYLNNLRVFSSIDSLIDIKIYKALLYEMLDIDIGATNEYKEIIKLKNSKEIFELYHQFIERTINMNSIK
jgi:hypothetical protein